MRPLNRLRRPRLDPAPSRLAYRLQRLMLMPAVRRLLRVGLPGALVLGLAAGYLSDPARRTAIVDSLAELRREVENRPEFTVRLMRVEGASHEVEEDLREIFPWDLPISSFHLPLDQIRTLVEGLPAVAEASVRLQRGGVLRISLRERQPATLWKTPDGTLLLDRAGAVIADLAGGRPVPDGLPLLAGTGADRAVAEALALLRAAEPLEDRVLGLVRVGERRWNLQLTDGRRILLPAQDPVPALERSIVLHETQDLLDRDIVAVDMRLPRRPTLRLRDRAVTQWRRVRAFSEAAVAQAGGNE